VRNRGVDLRRLGRRLVLRLFPSYDAPLPFSRVLTGSCHAGSASRSN